MNAAFAASVAVVGVGLGVTLVGEGAASRRLAVVGKPVASAGFLLAWWAAGLATVGVGAVLGVALFLSAVGDVLLLGRTKESFQAGIVAFLLGHVAFAGVLVGLGVDPVFTAVGVGVAGVCAALAWRWLSPHVGRMRGPVLAYVGVISSMVALSFGAFGAVPSGARAVVWGAAVLFYASDLFVARNRFVRASPWNRYIGLPLYYGAQVLWVVGVARAS